MPERNDPAASYNFVVELDNMVVAAFRELTGLEAAIEVIEHRDGGDRFMPTRKLPGKVIYKNLVLKVGVTADAALYEWFQEWAKGDVSAVRKHVRIVLLDRSGNAIRSWRAREAWPAKWIGPTFDADGAVVAVETFELAHEGFDLE